MRTLIKEKWEEWRREHGGAILSADLLSGYRNAFFSGALAAIEVQTKQIMLAEQFGSDANPALDAIAAEMEAFRAERKDKG